MREELVVLRFVHAMHRQGRSGGTGIPPGAYSDFIAPRLADADEVDSYRLTIDEQRSFPRPNPQINDV
jgi:hypothetical protein